MSEPLMPNLDPGDASTAAAEPGPLGPPPAHAEEPDVLPNSVPEPETDTSVPSHTPFRTPIPGDRLHPDELAAELADDDPERSEASS